MTSEERAQIGRDDDDEDLEGGFAAIEAHNKRAKKMATFTDEELQDTLDEFTDAVADAKALPAFREEMGKAIGRLQDDVAYGHLSQGQAQRRIAALHEAVNQVYADGLVTRKSVKRVAQVVDKLCKGLLAMAERATPPSKHAGLVALTKALLPPGMPMAEQVKAVQLLKAWFGPSGGQRVPFNTELAARLRLTKSYTQAEEARWQKYHLLPDWLDIQTPSRNPPVQWQSDAQQWQAQALTSQGACALGLEYYGRRLARR
jgi:hypothetical protein